MSRRLNERKLRREPSFLYLLFFRLQQRHLHECDAGYDSFETGRLQSIPLRVASMDRDFVVGVGVSVWIGNGFLSGTFGFTSPRKRVMKAIDEYEVDLCRQSSVFRY